MEGERGLDYLIERREREKEAMSEIMQPVSDASLA